MLRLQKRGMEKEWRCKCMENKFCAFICTHGRPNSQITYNMLRNAGYKSKIYFVVDNQDTTIQDYINNFGADNIIVFDKNHYINTVDTGINVLKHRCNLFPKSAMDNIATKLGLTSYVMLDDDVPELSLRYVDGDVLRRVKLTHDVETIFRLLSDFMFATDISTLGIGHPGMFFEGVKLFKKNKVERFRIPYAIVFRNLCHSVKWSSYVWEDNVTGMEYLKRGEKWFVFPYIQQQVLPFGKNSASGGMHDTYNSEDTLRLYMETIKFNPSSVRVRNYKQGFALSINTDCAYTKLISGRYKK